MVSVKLVPAFFLIGQFAVTRHKGITVASYENAKADTVLIKPHKCVDTVHFSLSTNISYVQPSLQLCLWWPVAGPQSPARQKRASVIEFGSSVFRDYVSVTHWVHIGVHAKEPCMDSCSISTLCFEAASFLSAAHFKPIFLLKTEIKCRIWACICWSVPPHNAAQLECKSFMRSRWMGRVAVFNFFRYNGGDSASECTEARTPRSFYIRILSNQAAQSNFTLTGFS